MTRYRVVRDGMGCPDDPPDNRRTWAVVDRHAADLVVKWCHDQAEAELTAALYETGEPVSPI